MKKEPLIILIILLTLILDSFHLAGARAYPHPKTIHQPDGTTLTILGHGDEFQNYVTTVDGYTIVKGKDGIYRYAMVNHGVLSPTDVRVSEISQRSSYELNYVKSLQPGLRPEISATGMKLRKLSERNAGLCSDILLKGGHRKMVNGKESSLDNYRGLVILVNFNDRKFSRGSQALQFVDNMMNKPDYSFYYDPLLHYRVSVTGSVSDYFRDNSNGKFRPEFDVVGPIEVDASQYYINGIENTYELLRMVLEASDPDIDFTRYDSDGDGIVDMVYILYAGYASVYQGNDERLIWPHAGDAEDFNSFPTFDGMRFGRFACSSEIFGWLDEGDLYLDGIGVIVHEFSHILGFKDHYDVSGYLNEDPGSWDVMASGNYNGVLNDTPCGYNSYEKYAAGFISPRTVTAEDDGLTLSLRPLSDSDDALRIESKQDSVIFLMENRQLAKWDKDLPGHGMLVWRVDSCDNEYWENNALNVNGRLHFKLIRATGPTKTLFQEIEDKDYDPFPGTRNVYDLTNYSIESNLMSTRNYPSPVMIRGIKEEEGMITLTLEADSNADAKPYTFSLLDRYSADGILEDGTRCEWNMHTATVEVGGRERIMIYDLVPDTKGISASDPKYAAGLGAVYSISGDRRNVYIEPYRVAITEQYGVWLVDFNNLDEGGSGAIVLDMDPYGNLSLSSPESVLGYCYMPLNSPLVDKDRIVERFSVVRNVNYGTPAGIDMNLIPAAESSSDVRIFNMQGMRVTNPVKGEIYVIAGKKVKF